jgi:hypothetical protein
VDIESLRVKCSVSVGNCSKGHTVAVRSSPHFAFASRAPGSTALFESYYTKAFQQGTEISDHSVSAFRSLRDSFEPAGYPRCTVGLDGRPRLSVAVVMDCGARHLCIKDGDTGQPL